MWLYHRFFPSKCCWYCHQHPPQCLSFCFMVFLENYSWCHKFKSDVCGLIAACNSSLWSLVRTPGHQSQEGGFSLPAAFSLDFILMQGIKCYQKVDVITEKRTSPHVKLTVRGWLGWMDTLSLACSSDSCSSVWAWQASYLPTHTNWFYPTIILSDYPP